MLNIHKIVARDLPDLWFQAVHDILDQGRRFTIDRGSYAGQTRLEYDYFMGHIKDPGMEPLLPTIPPAIGIPDPVDCAYIYGGEGYERSYVEYLMTATKAEGESYTYGERLREARVSREKAYWHDSGRKDIVDCRKRDGKILFYINGRTRLDQIEWIIDCYKKYGYRNNQMIMQIGDPSDLMLLDPPCLRTIDTRIQDNFLHFFVYFRSWDLWGGLPANLAGLSILQKYMADEIGVKQGEMVVESKGLHLYGYAEDLAKMRCMRD